MSQQPQICYLTGEPLTKENKSLEHIIPNAMGGVLKSRAILSKAGNQRLAEDIDVSFNKTFEGIYRRLPLARDRKTNWGVQGKHTVHQSTAILKNGKWFPKKPLYLQEENAVYAQTKEIGRAYIESQKQQGNIPLSAEIEAKDDLGGAFEISFPLNHTDLQEALRRLRLASPHFTKSIEKT